MYIYIYMYIYNLLNSVVQNEERMEECFVFTPH